MAITRQTITDAIETRAKTILISGGYHTDLGKNVFNWRLIPTDPGERPALILKDTLDEIDSESTTTPVNLHGHMLQMVATVISTDPTELRKAVADFYKMLGSDDTWGGVALTTILESDEIDAEQADVKAFGAIIRFKVWYRTQKYAESA